MVRVVKLSKVNSELLFEARQFLLGTPKKGSFIVIEKDGTPLGRYVDFKDAQEHADVLNDPSPSTLTLREALAFDEELKKSSDEY